MRRYETIVITDPDLQEAVQNDLFDKFRNLIVQGKGTLVDLDDWGVKKLAYDIRKKSRGRYVCLTYGGGGELVKELERNCRLDEKVLKFMTILIDKDTTLEALTKEIEAKAEAKKVQPAEAPEKDDPKTESDDSGDEFEDTEEED
ncbi:MAG: 30S ribosomal protein S6 [Pseudomonadota bacterium]